MRIQQVDSILKESQLARKEHDRAAHDHGGVMRKVVSALKSRKAQIAAGTVAGLAVTTAAAIFVQQNRRLRKFWELR